MNEKTMINVVQICAGVLMMSILLGGCNHSDHFSGADALTISRSGSFELDMTPEYAFPLFTAPGEKLWISIWDPIILNGDGYEQGTVWVTVNHGRTTHWYVADYDPDSRHARYVRTTPDADSGSVDVSVTSNDKGGSIVNVTYQLTGLSEAGNNGVQELLDEANYAAMMEEWRSMINDSRAQIDAHFSK